MRRFLQFAGLGFIVFLASEIRAEGITALGVLYVGEESKIELPFTNSGTKPVRIRSAETSCDCLTSEVAETEVPAGASTVMKFRYRATDVGPMRVDIKYLSEPVGAVLKQESVTGYIAQRDWYLTTKQLRDLQKSGDPAVVDIRRADRFALAHLPRSVNLPVFALSLQAPLKTRKVVLVEEGFSPAWLTEEAQRLRQAGFKDVAILEGGIASWIREGGAVEGANKSSLAAARITPSEFLRSQKTDRWEMVLASADQVAAKTADLNLSASGRLALRVLVVAPTDADYLTIETRRDVKSDLRVFYLTGGAKALAIYRADQLRMASNPGAVFQTKSLQPHVVATSGCGTCPKRP